MGFTPGMEEWFNMRASINVIQHTNRTKDKKPHESLKRYRKGLDKTQCLFMIITLKNKEWKESSSKF